MSGTYTEQPGSLTWTHEVGQTVLVLRMYEHTPNKVTVMTTSDVQKVPMLYSVRLTLMGVSGWAAPVAEGPQLAGSNPASLTKDPEATMERARPIRV